MTSFSREVGQSFKFVLVMGRFIVDFIVFLAVIFIMDQLQFFS